MCHTLRGCVDWNTNENLTDKVAHEVTPFVGVWIETRFTQKFAFWAACHTLRGCVDWNHWWLRPRLWNRKSHPSWVCGLKQTLSEMAEFADCHTLRGCVDWNLTSYTRSLVICVTPFVCVWIETPLPYHLFLRLPNHTLRGCMDWNRKQILFSEPTWKSHFYENVPLIVNKLQRQKIWFGTFFKWTQFSIIQQTLVQ